jgi:hypothetical protein
MRTSRRLSHIIFSLLTLLAVGNTTWAADPGLAYPVEAEVSDQKAGSVLIYNIYTSAAAGGTTQNTRVNITNTNVISAAVVHLFFVNSADCSIADSYICLTAAQTASFLASDIDPGVKGYIVAVATSELGCPINFNWLIGDEYVKFSSGHVANLGAEAFSAIEPTATLAACDGNSVTAVLRFNGVHYNRLPRALAVSNVPSRADGNDTMIIINRIGGNLAVGTLTTGTLVGALYDDAENFGSFSLLGACQLMGSLSNNFPRSVPRFEQFIPAGRSGWLRIYSLEDFGLLGASINFNPNTASQANAFNGGHNMHKLTLTETDSPSTWLTIPIFPGNC